MSNLLAGRYGMEQHNGLKAGCTVWYTGDEGGHSRVLVIRFGTKSLVLVKYLFDIPK